MIATVITALFDWDMEKITDWLVQEGFDGTVLNAHRGSPLDIHKLGDAGIANIQEMLARKNLGISSVADMSLNLLHPDDAERSSMIAYAHDLVDVSAKLGVNLVSMFGGRDPEKSVEDNIPRFKEVFTPLAEYAGERGVKIAFENCPLFEEFPYRGRNIAYSPAVWDMMFDAVPAANLGIELDTAHAVWLMQDLNRMIFDYSDRIFHIHFKDCHVDKDRLHTESIYGRGWWSYETPGDGDVDWDQFFASLHQIGYAGDWTFDLKGSTRLTELPRGLAFIKPILNRVFEPV